MERVKTKVWVSDALLQEAEINRNLHCEKESLEISCHALFKTTSTLHNI